MLIDCPHCLTKVVPKEDGSCPSCQEDTRDAAGCDLTKTTISVEQAEILPAVCCGCGRETYRYVRVKAGAGDVPLVGRLIALCFSYVWFLLTLACGERRARVVIVNVPQCEDCARDGRPQPRYVDYANARMTLVVHKSLKERLTR